MKCSKCKIVGFSLNELSGRKGICYKCKYHMVISGKGKEFDCI